MTHRVNGRGRRSKPTTAREIRNGPISTVERIAKAGSYQLPRCLANPDGGGFAAFHQRLNTGFAVEFVAFGISVCVRVPGSRG